MKRGVFVTLEGGEGVGKSTQAALLADALRARGRSVVLTREPGGTPGAEAIRALLMHGATDRWSARSEALLFAATRADLVERVIAPALRRGDWVVCDRFVDSSRAYQGGAKGLADDDVMALHRIGSDGLMPDRTLLLALSATEAAHRVGARDGADADRFAARSEEYHARLAVTFDGFARAEPERIRRVSAAGSIDEVAARLSSALVDLL